MRGRSRFHPQGSRIRSRIPLTWAFSLAAQQGRGSWQRLRDRRRGSELRAPLPRGDIGEHTSRPSLG